VSTRCIEPIHHDDIVLRAYHASRAESACQVTGSLGFNRASRVVFAAEGLSIDRSPRGWHAVQMSSGIGGERVDRDELRSVQAPLKDRYRADPAAAVVTLRATGTLGEGISCSVQTGRALAAAGLHPSTGGDGSMLCSGDMLLEALAACAGVTLRSVATSLGVEVRSGSVTAEGELDFRGTLAIDRDVPVGFRAIRVHFDLDTDASEGDLATLLRLTERYCVVLQTIAGTPQLRVEVAAAP
jgi:uncharacterized OsmC-like protein